VVLLVPDAAYHGRGRCRLPGWSDDADLYSIFYSGIPATIEKLGLRMDAVALAEPHPLAYVLMLRAVFMGLTFVVFVGYGLFAAASTSSGGGC
jgi:hypothetical protein